MSSTPFMQFYVGDYLKDTQHLTVEQHGAYLLLLMAMWGAGGTLPDDDAKLARIVRLTPAHWQRIKGDVMAFFSTAHGRLTQKRLAAELEKVREKSAMRAVCGRAGGVAKVLKSLEPGVAKATVLPEHSSYAEPDDRSSSSRCSEEAADPATRLAQSVFIAIPTNRYDATGEEVAITEAKVAEYEAAYPAVDVRQQLRQMRQWSIDKPLRRKTQAGIAAFVNGWLAREQNTGRTYDHDRNDSYRNGRKRSAHDNFMLGAAFAGGLVPGRYADLSQPADDPGDADAPGRS